MARSILCALTFALAAHVGTTGDERRITTAPNVRLRSAPATDASIAGELSLGTELVTLAQSSGAEPWYHVRTDEGLDGWVLGRLTTSLDPRRRDRTIESIVVARLSSGGGFSAGVQLFDLVERTAASLSDREVRGRFALYRLRSMSNVFHSVPFGVSDREVESERSKSEPFGSWIRAHLDAARYFESAGSWMVDPAYVQQAHQQNLGTSSGDEIAWFYVTNGLFGECEGDVPCYVDWQDRLNGWYLRSYPHGRHTDASDEDIARVLNDVMDNLQRFPAVLAEFDPKARCTELHRSLDPLRSAVTASTAVRKAEALAAIDRFARLCQ
jgi:Bacterial SH3 domain